MGLPYNPSSFATNKTILQAIEELKEYLKNNPCYKVYYVNTPYVVGTYTYNLSDVDDPDDTMTEYDVVFFTNSYYAKVIVVDTNTFDIDPAVSFQGPAGSTGPQGVSITGATIDASNHLIISLSDGNTIDAGLISAPINITYISGTYGTFTADEYTNLQKPDALISNANQSIIYRKVSNDLGGGTKLFDSIYFLGYSPYHYRIQVSSDRSWNMFNGRFTITNDNVYNNTAAGKVLTANGSNGATWEDIPSATYGNTVSITATSGTFSDSDFAKLGYGDSTIVYTDSYSVSTVYKLKLETASILEFEAIDAASRNNLKLIDVNKSTKAYSMTAISMITSSTISSGTATSGKVLTANGSGGCSWETAGGGTQKYIHNIEMWDNYNSDGGYTFVFSFINDISTPYSNATVNSLASAISSIYATRQLVAGGVYNHSTSIAYPIVSVSTNGTVLNVGYCKSDTYTIQTFATSSATIRDTVVAL